LMQASPFMTLRTTSSRISPTTSRKGGPSWSGERDGDRLSAPRKGTDILIGPLLIGVREVMSADFKG
jgi:hypothetical protein